MASVAVVGSGAVGLLYGGLCALAGHDLRFLLRRDRALLERDGLRIDTTPTPYLARCDGSTLRLPPTAFRACGEARACAQPQAPEWILLALKTTALDAARALVEPMLSPATRVVAMCNGLGVEERLAEWIAPERIFGAMAHVCVVRRDDGSVHHQAHGKLLLGHLLDQPARLAALAALWTSSGVASESATCLREARWRKLVWNFPYNGLSVVFDAATDALMREHRELVERVMGEVVAVANADLARAGAAARIDPVGWPREMLEHTERAGTYLTSTLLDHRAGRPLEVEAMFSEPLRRARALGVATPTMDWIGLRLAEMAGSPGSQPTQSS
jgi:2-dehydropantoate 2-reductase